MSYMLINDQHTYDVTDVFFCSLFLQQAAPSPSSLHPQLLLQKYIKLSSLLQTRGNK